MSSTQAKQPPKHVLVRSPKTHALWGCRDGLTMADWRRETGDPEVRPMSPAQVFGMRPRGNANSRRKA